MPSLGKTYYVPKENSRKQLNWGTESYRTFRSWLSDTHLYTLAAKYDLAVTCWMHRNATDAITMLVEALQKARYQEHPETPITMSGWACSLEVTWRCDEAAAI